MTLPSHQRNRAAAERRMSAIAAMHQPVLDVEYADPLLAQRKRSYHCAECSNRFDQQPWPRTTARILSP